MESDTISSDTASDVSSPEFVVSDQTVSDTVRASDTPYPTQKKRRKSNGKVGFVPDVSDQVGLAKAKKKKERPKAGPDWTTEIWE
jgi:hypothetical protein